MEGVIRVLFLQSLNLLSATLFKEIQAVPYSEHEESNYMGLYNYIHSCDAENSLSLINSAAQGKWDILEKVPIEKSLLQEFLDWVVLKNGHYNGIEIRTFTRNMRGLRFTESLPANHTLIRLPLKVLINEDFGIGNPIIDKSRKKFPPNILLTIILLHEMKAKTSSIRPYLNILPESVNNFPLLYNNEEIQMLDGTWMKSKILAFKYSAMQKYFDLTTQFPEFENVMHADFLKAYIYVISRSCGLLVDGKHKSSMVPLFDFINSVSPSNQQKASIKISYDHEIDSVVVKTIRAIKEGEDVLMQYRADFTNTEYLLYYGFTFEDIDSISFMLKIELADEEHLPITKEILNCLPFISVQGNIINIEVHNSEAQNYLESTLAVMRIIETHDEKVLEILYRQIKTGANKIPILSLAGEIDGLYRLRRACYNRLKEYPTTIETDEELFKDAPMFTNKRAIVRIRLLEKKLLAKIILYCTERIQQLSS